MDATTVFSPIAEAEIPAAGDLAVLNAGDADVGVLAKLGSRLVSLAATSLGGKALHKLFALELPRLRRLELSYCKLDTAALTALGAAPVASAVHELLLRGPAGRAAGIAALCGSPLFARLEELELSDGDCGDDGCEVLARAADKGQLRRLALGRQAFGARGAAANSDATARGVAALVGAPAFAKLERLDIALTSIDERLAARLVASPLARFVFLFPGSFECERYAPRGGRSLSFRGERELPGGPPEGALVGTIALDDGRSFADCGAGAVFSDDGETAALPVWERDAKGGYTGKSRVKLVSLDGKPLRDPDAVCDGSLALYAFEGGELRGWSALESQSDGVAFTARAPAR